MDRLTLILFIYRLSPDLPMQFISISFNDPVVHQTSPNLHVHTFVRLYYSQVIGWKDSSLK